MTDQPTKPTIFSRFKNLSLFQKLALLEFWIILLAIIAGYVYWQMTANDRQQVQKNLQYVEMLQTEKQTCTALIQKPEGNFSQFEYCKQLLEKFQ